MKSICNGWEFTPLWNMDFATGKGIYEKVRIPHTVKEISLHYADSDSYQMICGYRRKIEFPGKDKRVFVRFDGAAHIATVYLNGEKLCEHRCGYTAFSAELTKHLKDGENILAVRLDTTENSEIPPFGFVVDYLTYGGLYRPVWLDIKEKEYINDVFVRTPDLNTVHITADTDGDGEVTAEILDGDSVLATGYGNDIYLTVEDAVPWTVENNSPKRYLCCVTLTKDGKVLDTNEILFGFRTAEFLPDGFYLNGKKLFLRGLNRHQCFPYAGDAMPESLQREDARILKYELGCNAVRTSHYPQSHYFIDECDKIGLAVFTEIPGWQHIGDENWKLQAIENTKEMVTQYRNHPSVILWGVRINESLDDDGFYSRTNLTAHSLDETRATSGVRYITKSSLLEDVYAFNDFSYDGDGDGTLCKEEVTDCHDKPLLVSEHNGHMFPVKIFDKQELRQSQALRHSTVLSSAMEKGEAGCFGWCMADYPTHKDFGSGDRVCYHGVCDRFRNPKAAAYFYRSQGENENVLFITSSMDIGDYPAGRIGCVFALTNTDSVKLYKNGKFVKEFFPKESPLPHPPIEIDDTVGAFLETEEGFSLEAAELLKECLFALRDFGESGIPCKTRLRMLTGALKYGLTKKKIGELFTKYINNWGSSATIWEFEGIKDGLPVTKIIKKPETDLHLELSVSNTELTEGDTYDVASVRIKVCDKNNNAADYAFLPVKLTLDGVLELIGPDTLCTEGAYTGTYVKTVGKEGKATLTVTAPGISGVTVEFNVKDIKK